MGATKKMALEYFCIIPEEVYYEIEMDTRMKFISAEARENSEYEMNKEDPKYKELYQTQRKAKESLQEYLFTKRNKL